MMDLGKYLFISEYKDGNKITHEFRGDASLDDMIQNFEYFLKGCGYHFEGHLDIVQDEESSYQERKEMYDAMDDMMYTSSFNTPNYGNVEGVGGDYSSLNTDFGPTVTFTIDDGKYPAEDSGIEDMTAGNLYRKDWKK